MAMLLTSNLKSTFILRLVCDLLCY